MSAPPNEETTAPGSGPRSRTREINTRGRSLRGWAARGMIVGTGFSIGLNVLSLVRGFLLAVFLSRSDYGVWGVLGVTLGLLSRLKLVGIGDKYVQQDDDDQELAFQRAFTLEVLMTLIVLVPLLLALPLIAVVYGHWSLVPPGAVVLMGIPASALQAPIWILFRRMEFIEAATLQALDPIVGFIVTLGLAIAGAGYWSFIGGVVAGAWSVAIAAVIRSPYPLRWRYDRGTMRIYRSYSWPLLLASVASIVLANSASLAVNATLGLAGIGVVALASNITQFTNSVDDIVSGALYPAVCAAQDRLELLRESFEKANRMSLIWAMPFGVGLALFIGDLVKYGLGDKWRPAIQLLQITGVVAALGHIGFNWDDYYRARGETKPIGLSSVVVAISFVAVGVPLTLAFGLRGLGLGIGFQALVALGFRAFYLARLFNGFGFIRHATRAMVPAMLGAIVTLLMRAAAGGSESPPFAAAEIASFLVVTASATWMLEGPLVREALGYLRERRMAGAASP